MDWRDISILISLTAIFISLMPFLIDLCEDYGKPDWASEDELNEMCDKEVQAEPLKRRRRVMPDRFTSLG